MATSEFDNTSIGSAATDINFIMDKKHRLNVIYNK